MPQLINVSEPEAEAAAAAAAALRRPGAVVLVPTETVYGLVARSSDREAAERIYELKHRSGSKRLGWFVGDWRILRDFGVILDGLPEKLAARYCPGPLTLIAPTTSGDTIGFRIPDHPFLTELLAMVGEPLYQTSANRSGHPDARDVADALAQLDGDVDLAVDGGELPPGAAASTVVDATGAEPRILRQGALVIE